MVFIYIGEHFCTQLFHPRIGNYRNKINSSCAALELKNDERWYFYHFPNSKLLYFS